MKYIVDNDMHIHSYLSLCAADKEQTAERILQYAKENGYKIDEMAILALHNRISNIERIDQATTLTEVKEIIDEAIDREAHSGLKKAISILTAKRYTDDDRIVLKEDHFKEK